MIAEYLKRLYYRTYEIEAKRVALNLHERNENAKVLDCGCGTGKYTMEVAYKIGAKDIVGIDVTPEVVAVAKGNGVVAEVANINEPWRFDSGYFDAIHATGIIDHLDDTDNFFAESYRVLKTGGYMVILTSNLAAYHHILSLLFGRQPSIAHISSKVLVGTLGIDGEHWETLEQGCLKRVFTLRALLGLCWYYNFNVEKVIGAGYYPLPPKLATFMCKVDKTHSAYLVIKVRK